MRELFPKIKVGLKIPCSYRLTDTLFSRTRPEVIVFTVAMITSVLTTTHLGQLDRLAACTLSCGSCLLLMWLLFKWSYPRRVYHLPKTKIREKCWKQLGLHTNRSRDPAKPSEPWAVPWLRRLVAGLSPPSPGFDTGSVHVGFVVDKVALGQVFPLILRFSPVSFNPPVLKKTNHLRHRVAQLASRLRCVRSICCGAIYKKNLWTFVCTAFWCFLCEKDQTCRGGQASLHLDVERTVRQIIFVVIWLSNSELEIKENGNI
jgi:hypothetical protein